MAAHPVLEMRRIGEMGQMMLSYLRELNNKGAFLSGHRHSLTREPVVRMRMAGLREFAPGRL